ncbi:hypothetical protein KR067_013691 [Drosophila pandora]|nr:hypothetical protein KR067_013691 [Drosophila pandora]
MNIVRKLRVGQLRSTTAAASKWFSDKGNPPPKGKDSGQSKDSGKGKDSGKAKESSKDKDGGKGKSGGTTKGFCQGDGKKKEKSKNKKVTMIMGEGVGPEVMCAVQQVLKAAKAPIEWEIFEECKSPDNEDVPPTILESLERNKVGIKGPVASRNWQRHLRKAFEQFAYVSIVTSLKGVKTPFGCFDVVMIRDQMEGDYSGIEHLVVPGVMQTIKVSTTAGAQRIAKFIFNYALKNNRSKISVAHKANIMRMTDGNFLDAIHEEANKHVGKVHFEERYLDTVITNLLMTPSKNDIVVSSSMYGDVMRVMTGAMMGAPGITPGYSVSDLGYVFECRSKLFCELVGKNLMNPTGSLLSAVLMLRHLKMDTKADLVECGVRSVYANTDIRTQDLGGCASCSEFVEAVCDQIKSSMS